MKFSLPLASASLLGLIAAAPIAQEITFGPEEGTTVTKSFETTLDIALDDLIVNFNGIRIARPKSLERVTTSSVKRFLQSTKSLSIGTRLSWSRESPSLPNWRWMHVNRPSSVGRSAR